MELITHLLAFLGGLGTAYTFKFFVSIRGRRYSKSSSVTQNRNTAGGDIVGGNSTKAEK